MVLVDRPWPVDGEYRGVKYKIDFMWGADDDPIPAGIRVAVDPPNPPVLYSGESKKYDSYDDALSSGKKSAEREIDQILGANPDA